jgi:hypothetical protein
MSSSVYSFYDTDEILTHDTTKTLMKTPIIDVGTYILIATVNINFSTNAGKKFTFKASVVSNAKILSEASLDYSLVGNMYGSTTQAVYICEVYGSPTLSFEFNYTPYELNISDAILKPESCFTMTKIA